VRLGKVNEVVESREERIERGMKLSMFWPSQQQCGEQSVYIWMSLEEEIVAPCVLVCLAFAHVIFGSKQDIVDNHDGNRNVLLNPRQVLKGL
jgi:hypothetical protein